MYDTHVDGVSFCIVSKFWLGCRGGVGDGVGGGVDGVHRRRQLTTTGARPTKEDHSCAWGVWRNTDIR